MDCYRLLRTIDPTRGANAKPERETFLVLEGKAWEASKLIGQLKVNEKGMRNFMEWLMPEYHDAYVLLVSLDGRRGFPIGRVAIEKPFDGDEIFYIGEFFFVEGIFEINDSNQLIKIFKVHLSEAPEFAKKIGYVAPRRRIPSRVRFDEPAKAIVPGQIHSEITQALHELRAATDDALVWLAISGPNSDRGYQNYDYEQIIREIDWRIRSGESLQPRFFSLRELDMSEILKRQKRADALLKKFKREFDFSADNFQISDAEAWLSRLDNDRLGELAVHSFYSNARWGAEHKVIVHVFQERMRRLW